MDADDIGIETRDEHEHDCDSHHHSRWLTRVQAPGLLGKPTVGPSYGEANEQDVAYPGKKYVERGKAVGSVDKCDCTKSQQDPADDCYSLR